MNINSNRGVERVQTFANTIIDIICDANATMADTEKVGDDVMSRTKYKITS